MNVILEIISSYLPDNDTMILVGVNVAVIIMVIIGGIALYD